jgi:diaminopimelate epimerase
MLIDNLKFTKMTGSGNDFIIIDNRDNKIRDYNTEFIKKVCTRSLSVGADGIIFIENSMQADFKWSFFNSDGSVAEMCGNGSRCVAKYAYLNGIAGKKMRFETLAGIISAEIKDDEYVKVQLTKIYEEKIYVFSRDDVEKITIKGEFVIVIDNNKVLSENKDSFNFDLKKVIKELKIAGFSNRDILKIIKAFGLKRNEAYEILTKEDG